MIDCTEENEVFRAITYASQQFTAPNNRIANLEVICRQEGHASLIVDDACADLGLQIPSNY